MILPIILLVVIILILALLILFLFYMLFPSIKSDELKDVDPFLSPEEINIKKDYEESVVKTSSKAYVLNDYDSSKAKYKINFNSKYSCSLIHKMYGTNSDSSYFCIGLGDCVKICPQQAISIEKKVAVVSNLCIGCGKCINVCPKKMIKLIPIESTENNEKIIWNDKKDFKIWTYCYKLYNAIRKRLLK